MDSFQVLFSLWSTCVFKFSFFFKENNPNDLQHCLMDVICVWKTVELYPWVLSKEKVLALH